MNSEDPKVVPFVRPTPRTEETDACRPPTLDVCRDAITEAIQGAEWSAEHLDAVAIEDEHRFKQRFGFDACKAKRQQIIDFKQREDMTDHDLRLLRRSGSLQFLPDGIRILAPALIAAYGYFQIAVLGVLMLLPVLAFGFKRPIVWPMFLGTILVDAVLLWLMKLSSDMYIQPYEIKKRVAARR